jgi:sterol desaturase/sphingolipid hydroxylase (fatty acid hydroxylase superfamily)
MHHHYSKGNYGLYFNFWDRLMGTNHPNYEKEFLKVAKRAKDQKLLLTEDKQPFTEKQQSIINEYV